MKGLFGNPNNEKKDRSIFNNAAPIKNSLFPSIHNNDSLFPKNSLFPSIHNNDGLFVDIPRNISFRFDDNNNNKYDLFAPYNDYNQGNSLFFNNNHHGNRLFICRNNNVSLFGDQNRNYNNRSLFRCYNNNIISHESKKKSELIKNDKQIDLIIKSSNFNNTNKISKEYEENINNKKKIEKEEKHRNGKSLEFVIFMIIVLLISILIEQSVVLGFLLRK